MTHAPPLRHADDERRRSSPLVVDLSQQTCGFAPECDEVTVPFAVVVVDVSH